MQKRVSERAKTCLNYPHNEMNLKQKSFKIVVKQCWNFFVSVSFRCADSLSDIYYRPRVFFFNCADTMSRSLLKCWQYLIILVAIIEIYSSFIFFCYGILQTLSVNYSAVKQFVKREQFGR